MICYTWIEWACALVVLSLGAGSGALWAYCQGYHRGSVDAEEAMMQRLLSNSTSVQFLHPNSWLSVTPRGPAPGDDDP
jgi:hypothetical protein